MRSPRPWVLLVAVIAGLTMAVPTPRAAADRASIPFDNTIRITGAGHGHGWGMSQYGAYGAAKRGLSWRQITAFYYPGTSVTPLPSNDRLVVWLSADNDRNLTVKAAGGLQVQAATNGKARKLPTGSNYTEWRIVRSGSSWELYHRDAKRTWREYDARLGSSALEFANPSSGRVGVVMPSGTTATYRDRVGLILDGSSLRSVNIVSMENYLRGVVASEMPASWSSEALRAQSVAARTYAARLRTLAGSRDYDLCDTTACQVYKGVAAEHPNTDAAIKATAGSILTYGGRPINALFSASNGGHTAYGKEPYLPAKPDPYDGGVTNQSWTMTVTGSQLSSRYGVGTVRSVQVATRDGDGRWGGRVDTVRIVGSSRTVTVSGATLRSQLGLRSTLFTVTGGVASNSSTYRHWQNLGGVTGRVGAPSGDQQTITGGQRAPFDGGVIYSSSAGTRLVNGMILGTYSRINGPVTIGMPITDEVAGPLPGSRMNRFTRGVIYWSSPTGAHEVHGAILSTYSRIDGPTVIGLPTSDERPGPVTGSLMNSFRGGVIYWSPRTGANELYGAILGAYQRVDGPRTMGLPTTGERAAKVSGARMTQFSDGAVYWSPRTGARAVSGDTWAAYQEQGRESGRLGLPISDTTRSGSTTTTRFTGGEIRCTSSCSVRFG